MSNSLNPSLPSDIDLLLRADAEQYWLHREVIPALRHLETLGELPDEEVGAALAYLEAMWNEAALRARATDSAHAHLRFQGEEQEMLSYDAGRYHAAVRVLRGVLAERVTPLVDYTQADPNGLEKTSATLRVTDARYPPTGGRTPRAA